jgi:hypothetical protein
MENSVLTSSYKTYVQFYWGSDKIVEKSANTSAGTPGIAHNILYILYAKYLLCRVSIGTMVQVYIYTGKRSRSDTRYEINTALA